MFIFYFSLLHCSNYDLLLHASFSHSFIPFLFIDFTYTIHTHTHRVFGVALAHFFRIYINPYILALNVIIRKRRVFFLFFIHLKRLTGKKIRTWEKRDRNEKEWLNGTTRSKEWENGWGKNAKAEWKTKRIRQYQQCHVMPCHATTWYILQFRSVIVYFTLIFASRISLASLTPEVYDLAIKSYRNLLFLSLFYSLYLCLCHLPAYEAKASRLLQKSVCPSSTARKSFDSVMSVETTD